MPDVLSLEALNEWLETRWRELWLQTGLGTQPGSIAEVWLRRSGT